MDGTNPLEDFNRGTFLSNDLNKRFMVTFYGKELGVIDIDDRAQVQWEPIDHELCSVLSKSKYADMPAMVHNIHPNQSIIGFLLNAKTKEEYYKTHFKTLSNVRFFQLDGYQSKYAFQNASSNIDQLDGLLESFTKNDGVAELEYDGPVGTVGLERLPFTELKKLTSVLEHRISGNESKAFAHLSKKGKLKIASEGRAFTHFIKYGEAGGRESHPLMEWMGLQLMEEVGLPVAKAALMKVDDQCSPALVIERFDIPHRNEETEAKKLIQDFYTIFGRDPERDVNRETSTYGDLLNNFVHFNKDLAIDDQKKLAKSMITRIVSAWAMSDDDLHPKNFSILMDIDTENSENSTYDMSPAYDGHINIACGSNGASTFYKMNDTDQYNAKVTLDSFLSMLKKDSLSIGGKPFCVFDDAEDVTDFVKDISSKCAHKAAEIASNPPAFLSDLLYGEMYLKDMKLGAAVVIERAKSIGADYPKGFEYAGIFKWAKKYGPKGRSAALKDARDINLDDPNCRVLVANYRQLLKKFENPNHACSAKVKKHPALAT